MDRNKPDWEKDLSPPPHQERGFDDKLRRRIEERLDRKEARRRMWLWPAAGLSGALAMSALVFLFGPFHADRSLEAQSGALSAAWGSAAGQQARLSKEAEPAAKDPAPIKSGVLIGLRQDYAAAAKPGVTAVSPASTYRTLMLAPVNGQVSVAAEGSGILVPYGQKFWKIDAVTHTTETDAVSYLSVHPADKTAEAASFTDRADERLLFEEKLLFAGNQYVSVAEDENVQSTTVSHKDSRVWVRKLNQMAEPDLPRAITGSRVALTASPSHVTVEDIFGEGARKVLSDMQFASFRREDGLSASLGSQDGALGEGSVLSGDNWAIVRQPGRWSAKVMDLTAGTEAGSLKAYSLLDYPEALPETVTSHDKVTSTWGQVKSLSAGATDLLSSPLEDLMIVFTDKEMVLFSSSGEASGGNKPLLTIELEPGEHLVSAQWATGSYVGEWVEKSRKFLQGNSEGR